MPEITVVQIALLTVMIVIGVLIGWTMRGNRAKQEKSAVNAGWQEQLEAQRQEHERLQGQNKSLMEQVSQFQASHKDATNRARELSGALKEAFARRDELQREIKDVRNTLQAALGERDKLETDMKSLSASDESLAAALQKRDEKIARLSRELENWHGRLPPLIERYNARNLEAEQLEAELNAAKERIDALETMLGSEETRVEPVDPDSLSDGMDASNDPVDDDEDEDLLAADVIMDDGDDIAAADDDDDDDDDDADEVFGDNIAKFVSFDRARNEDEPDDSDEDREAAGNPDDDGGTILEALNLTSSDDDQASDIAHDDPPDDPDATQSAEALTGEYTSPELEALEQRDDLKQIKGVGPAIEKTLNELGIFTISQIAEMTEYDIDRVARRLKGFRTRIYREDWMGQARSLLDEQASEQA